MELVNGTSKEQNHPELQEGKENAIIPVIFQQGKKTPNKHVFLGNLQSAGL